MSIAALFALRSVHHLEAEYLPRIERALGVLSPEDLWWRPNDDVTSVGNLLLHLEGNVRQWILSGLAGASDARIRQSEFDAREGSDAATLFGALRETVGAACRVIEDLDDGALAREHVIQDFETTTLAAVYHIVEHFAWHTGQITWIAKSRAGEGHGLEYYDDEELNRGHNRR